MFNLSRPRPRRAVNLTHRRWLPGDAAWTRVVMAVLVLMLAAGPVLRYAAQSALADDHTLVIPGTEFDPPDLDWNPPPIILEDVDLIVGDEGDCIGVGGDTSGIPVTCPLPAGMLALDNQAVTTLLAAHQLPASDRNRIFDWERDAVRALTFAWIVDIIMKDPAQRTQNEQLILDNLAGIVRANRIEAAERARYEYDWWAANKCGYVAPAGFTYEIDFLLCSSVNPLFAEPAPPSLEEFLAYGAAHVYSDFASNPLLEDAASETAMRLGTLGGFAAVGVGAGVGAAIGASLGVGSPIIHALHPFLIVKVMKIARASSAAVAGTSAGGVGAASIAGAIGIIITAIVIAVIHGINVFEAAEIPGEIDAAIADAGVTPDLSQLIDTDAGKREIYAAFVRHSVTPFNNPIVAPNRSNSDRMFVVTDGGNTYMDHTLDYQCWNPVHCAGTINHTVSLHEGWFIDTGQNSGSRRLTLGFDYVDWNGQGWTAERMGEQFMHTRTGDANATPFLSAEIKFKAWDGTNLTASLASLNHAPTVTGPSVTSGEPLEGSLLTFTTNGADIDNNTLTYTWDFGDGTNPVVGPNSTVSHAYADNGTYEVSITADDGYGDDTATATASTTIEMANVAPTAVISGAPETSPEGTEITVTADISDPGSADTHHVAWAVKKNGTWWKDSGTENSESFTFTPDNNGEYVVSLLVMDDDEGLGGESATIQATNAAPSVSIDYTPPTSPEGTTIDLTGSATDPGSRDSLSFRWEITTWQSHLAVFPDVVAAGNGESISFTPDDNGNYIATLTVTDNDGGVGTTTASIQVTNVAPHVTAAGVTIDENDLATVSGTIADPGSQDTFTLSVDWQDGSAPETFSYPAGTTEFTLERQYLDDDPTGTASDVYDAGLTVTDNDGGEGSATAPVTVNNLDPVVTIDEVTSEMDVLLPGLELSVSTSYTDTGTLDTHTAAIGWGDGMVTDITAGVHSYSRPGTYTLGVTVTDDDTGVGEATRQITVLTPAQAVAEAIDELRSTSSTNRAASATLKVALVILEGNTRGRTNTGALNMLERGNHRAGLTMLMAALTLLERAETMDRSLDLTAVQELLALTAKSAAVTAINDAQASVEASSQVSQATVRQLDRAIAAQDAGNQLLDRANYRGAAAQYLKALALVPHVIR